MSRSSFGNVTKPTRQTLYRRIDEKRGVRAGGDFRSDFGEAQAHRFSVAPGHDEGRNRPGRSRSPLAAEPLEGPQVRTAATSPISPRRVNQRKRRQSANSKYLLKDLQTTIAYDASNTIISSSWLLAATDSLTPRDGVCAKAARVAAGAKMGLGSSGAAPDRLGPAPRLPGWVVLIRRPF